MASYVVLARKWRPAQFADIVGQNHIVRTLTNAIRADRIHQAYLFTGSRGIGKTSIARIFAKVLRCEHKQITPEGIRSCDQCASCKEITLGTSVDVVEIDGASNNGVEAVREIRENAKYLPATGARKIYIIDEVHMLTTAAFNALLKTLEEPPAHVVFIFATTEPHKIPPTILSRVQRFDYRRATVAQNQTLLIQIAAAEKVQVEPAALALIARAAEGSMRDALSLLDQVIAFSGNQISLQSVRESIGLVEGQTLLGIISGIFLRKPLEAIALIEKAYEQGHDLRVLTRHLIEFLHAAILIKVGATKSNALEISDEEWQELSQLAKARELEEIELIFQVLHQGLDWIARSTQPKVILDVLIIKCATADALILADAPATPTPEKPTIVKMAQPASSPAPVGIKPPAPINSAPTNTYATVTPIMMAAKSEVPIKMEVVPPAPVKSLEKTWEGFIESVRGTKPLLASILEHGSPGKIPSATSSILEIFYRADNSYFCEQLQSRGYSQQLASLAKDYFDQHIRVAASINESGESVIEKKEKSEKLKQAQAQAAAKSHPLIMEAKSLFGGELGPIEILEENDDAE